MYRCPDSTVSLSSRKILADRKSRLPQIVFATAFDHYAVKAFEVNAVGLFTEAVRPIATHADSQKGPHFIRRKVKQGSRPASRRKASGFFRSQARRFAAYGRRARCRPALPAPARSGKVVVRAANRLLLVDQRDMFASHRDRGRHDLCSHQNARRGLQLPHARRTAGATRPGAVLACASVIPGQHPAHPRSCAVVQVLLPTAHGRPQTDRNSG